MQKRVSKHPYATQRERVYEHIKLALMSGAYEPGQKITIAAVADALHVSAMPVREALRRLVAERALAMKPNHSVTVPRLSRAEILELRKLREVIEGYAVELAAARITPAELEALDQQRLALAAARDRRDAKAVLRANEAFHFQVYAAARVPVMMEVIATLWMHSAPTLTLIFAPGRIARYPSADQTRNNRALIDALRRRNGKAARAALQKEIAEGSRLLDAAMQESRWDAPDEPRRAPRSNRTRVVA